MSRLTGINPSRMPDPARIRTKLAEAVAAERVDALKFSILTVILTPAFAALAGVILLIAVHQVFSDSSTGRNLLQNDHDLVHATTLFLLLSCGSFFLRSPEAPTMGWKDLVWFSAGLAVLGLILYLTYGGTMRQSHPKAFWWLYGVSAILMLGMIGRGYSPRDEYYMRPGEWSFDELPQDRFDRQSDYWLGFAVAFPRMILGSYGDVFGGLWMWQGLDERGLALASEVLKSLGARDPKSAEGRLRSGPPAVSGRVIRWLLRLEFIRKKDGRLGLSSGGERFLGVSEWTVV